METQNIMASSYPLKVSSTQNKGFLFFSNAKQELNQSDFYSIEEEVSSLSSYLLPTHKKKKHTYFTDSQKSTLVLKKYPLV